jgi:hypothetical protein
VFTPTDPGRRVTIEPETPDDLTGHFLELVGGTHDGMQFYIDGTIIAADWSVLTEQWLTPTDTRSLVWLRERYLPDLVEGAGMTIRLTEDGRAVRYLLEKP